MKLKNSFGNSFSKLKELFLKNKKIVIALLCLVIVVLICCFSSFSSSKISQSNVEQNIEQVSTSNDYGDILENKIKKMLLSLDEVDMANVMVVCDATVCYDYLKDIDKTTTESENSTSTTISEDVVYQKNGSNSTPIIVSSRMPKIVGVWIITNALSPSTKLSIITSVSSVLNIEQSCISILQER